MTREIQILITAKKTGKSVPMVSYPVKDGKVYKVPTYYLIVSGTDDFGFQVSRRFEVTRFGPLKLKSYHRTSSRGWHWSHWKTIVRWDRTYPAGNERGAWAIQKNTPLKKTLIHDGGHRGATFATATQGCVGICGAPRGFGKFNDHLILMSGLSTSKPPTTRQKKLHLIGASRKMKMKFEHAKPPPLVIY